MRVNLQSYLSDPHIDAHINSSQRQLSLAISAIGDRQSVPLNLCLVLDRSGSSQRFGRYTYNCGSP